MEVRTQENRQAAFQNIPVIDISPLLEKDDTESKQRVGEELHAACSHVGFFYVRNHGIPAEVLTSVLRQARSWFSLPAESKRQIELSPSSKYRGYQPLGANVTRYDQGFSRDWHEGIDLYREGKAGASKASPVHGENPWPHQLPEFEAILRQYINACLDLGQTIMRGIALGLGLPERYFEDPENGGTTAETSYWVSRVLHYPPLSEGDAHQPELMSKAALGEESHRSLQLSCGEHTDYGLLTLVNQEEGVTALQAKNQAGQWINAPPIPGTLVCNLGDMLKVYTNGLYTPTAHRVINANPTKSRVSIPFFYETAFDSVVKPIDQLVANSQAPYYPAVHYGSHLLSKVLNNFEFEPQEQLSITAAS